MITIRPAALKDLPSCEILMRHPYLEYTTGGYPDIEYLKHFISDTYFLVAEFDGKIIGLILSEPIKVEGVVWWSFIVAEAYRGKKVGSKLYDEFEKRVCNDRRKWIYLNSHINNSIATEFYIRKGFHKGKPHFEMAKEL